MRFFLIFIAVTFLSCNSENKKITVENSLIKIYQIKNSRHYLPEMWWNQKWPYVPFILESFDLKKLIDIPETSQLDNFFKDSTIYNYKAITTLSPNYRIQFYDNKTNLYKEILINLESSEGEASLIIQPKDYSQGNKCFFLTFKASKKLWIILNEKQNSF